MDGPKNWQTLKNQLAGMSLSPCTLVLKQRATHTYGGAKIRLHTLTMSILDRKEW